MQTDPDPPPIVARRALSGLWQSAGLEGDADDDVTLPGAEPALPTSFPVATALQAALGAAARAAARIGRQRGGPEQTVSVDALDVVRESAAHFLLNGRSPEMWDKISGLYACGGDAAPGWVRIHTNFEHHRDGALRLLGLPPGPGTERAAVAAALQAWRALDFEQAAADAGLVVAALRRFDEWDAHPQGAAVAAQPLVSIERSGDAPVEPAGPLLEPGQRPLQGLRVLDLTRILAGPVAGRTLASFGADVMLVNSPHLPNIESIADTSRGKLSVHVDLRTGAGRDTLRSLVREADVFLQGYRPGALAALGFGPDELARLRPGLVCVSLSAYGSQGPWAGRRGFDSLVQTATGFNHAEALAFGQAEPRALPLQALDYGAGFLLAFGAQAALLRRAHQGGSWQVQVSLARTGLWLRSLGRCLGFQRVAKPGFDDVLETQDSGFGRLQAVRPSARFSHTPAAYVRPSRPPGSHPPAWPPR
jgi:crotonobetainyl-CoA:carnitine CoA-transferase CaiB-like acyl-CoA transferase